MNKEISLTEKLILYFVLFGIFALITVVSYSYYRTKKAILERTFNQLTIVRIQKKNTLAFLNTDVAASFAAITWLIRLSLKITQNQQ